MLSPAPAVSTPEKLKAARLRRRLTQDQVGRLLNPPIDHSLISRYESGLRVPPETLAQLAKLLDLDLAVIERNEAIAS